MPVDERELDDPHGAERLEFLAPLDGEVVDAELEALAGLRRAVGLAGLEVGDPRAPALELADPVDHPGDRGALELELEPLLVRERLADAVVVPPVREHPFLDLVTEVVRDGLRGELRSRQRRSSSASDSGFVLPTLCCSRSSIRPCTSLPTQAW